MIHAENCTEVSWELQLDTVEGIIEGEGWAGKLWNFWWGGGKVHQQKNKGQKKAKEKHWKSINTGKTQTNTNKHAPGKVNCKWKRLPDEHEACLELTGKTQKQKKRTFGVEDAE